VSKDELTDELGNPDSIIGPQELYGILSDKDASYADMVLRKLWEAYQRVTPDVSLDVGMQGNARWQDCSAFKSGVLWIYDESKHFDKPIVWGWNTRTGFTSIVFYIEEQHVLYTLGFSWWPRVGYPSSEAVAP